MNYFREEAELAFLAEDFMETNRPLSLLREITTERAAEVTSLRFTEAARVVVRIGRSLVMSRVYLQVR